MTAPLTSTRLSPGATLRQAYSAECLAVPGVFNALVARLAERAGFQALYQSGAALSAGLAGIPDVGLLTLTEFAEQGRYLTQAVQIPVISDADTGFGEPLSVERTIQQYEAAGLAGLHLEDQELPKRCGHLSGKSVVETSAMVAKLHAAVRARRDPDFVIIARTDARSVSGLDEALRRAEAYLEAGADLIFPEAMEDAAEFARFGQAFPGKLMANMTEFGRSPLLTVAELGGMGYRLVLFPVTLLRIAMRAVESALDEIQHAGTQQQLLPAMQTRAELYELLGYEQFNQRDRDYFGKS